MSAEGKGSNWPVIIATGVSIISLLVNGIQAYANYTLQKEKTATETKLNSLEVEKRRLENLARTRELSVDLETRLFFISGMGLVGLADMRLSNSEDDRSIGLIQTKVFRQLQENEWMERWDMGGDILHDDEGNKKAHAVVFLKVRNIGKQDAKNVKLTVLQKDYSPEGEHGSPLWELDTTDWGPAEIRLADLRSGESVLVPLAHILGSSSAGTIYFGRQIVAKELSWFNPTLQKAVTSKVTEMAPEDQWISQGLNISVAQ